LDDLEIEFIAKFRGAGEALTNQDSGGKSMSEWHREKLREMKIGVPRSEETKAKISEAKKGTPSHMKGKHHTEETKAQISASRKGKLLGDTHHQYRQDISTEWILAKLDEGWTKVAIAKELGKSSTFVHRRVAQARRTLGKGAYRRKRLPEEATP
jgi:NUMOD3 motif